MIQRIQSVYIVLGVALLASAPFIGKLGAGPAASLAWYVPAVGAVLGLAALIAAIAIFLYGDRKRQRGVVIMAQFLTLLAVGVVFVGRQMTGSLPGPEASGVTDWLLFLLPMAAYACLFLGRKSIDRDIKLVRSMDRLR